MPKHWNESGRRIIFPIVTAFLLFAAAFSVRAQTIITNLQQLTETLDVQQQMDCDVRLEATVCAASRPQTGVLIVQDESGVELLEMENFGQEINPGDRVLIQSRFCLARKRDIGIELCARPVVNNDGTHSARTLSGSVTLNAGLNPMELDWFNYWREFNLKAQNVGSNGIQQSIDSSNLLHAAVDEAGHTNFLPGLRAECYEGRWETAPDFNLLQPVKVGTVTNFDTSFRTRDELVGIRYTGYFNAPYTGQYTFSVRSDDGSLLFLGNPNLPIKTIGSVAAPTPDPGLYGETMQSLTERRWVEMEGRVGFVTQTGVGLEFDLCSDRDKISVQVADAKGLDPSRLLHSRVKIQGVARGVLTTGQQIVLGKIFVASAKNVVVLEKAPVGEPALPITTIRGVQSLPIEKARNALPVHIRGVVTDARNPPAGHWMSIQDDTHGIFVNLAGVTNTPAFGECWDVEGHSGAGDFAPVLIADKMTLLGDGRLPEPISPTWYELINGSQDVQWAELSGLVTTVRSNTLTLLLPEGKLNVHMDGFFESDLHPFEKCVVRIRGVLYAIWNIETHEVSVGNVMMRNGRINVDVPAPANPFDVVLKTPHELLMFNAQATAFRPVKVRGQIIYADASQMFLEEGNEGLRLLPAEEAKARPGDLVEAVGYPDIAQKTLVLREAILRKTGSAPLPDPKTLVESEMTREDLDSTRVRTKGELLGWHFEQGRLVLEMQSGTHLYLARFAHVAQLSLQIGSKLALDGVYVSHTRNQRLETGANSFELLLNSTADIHVLSQPSWWTLKRLLILTGILLAILIFTVVWITQLQRSVEQRVAQLQHEIGERERLEHRNALEAERSRIARDLHDDLGSSLTEISVLASTGQRPEADSESQTKLFHSITGKARNLIASLDIIVWAIDPEENSLQSLADYLTSYAEDYFSHTNVSCRFKVPISFPQITLEGRVRHDLLMVVKEALNNIVRHAEAAEVEFRMAVAGNKLEIEITDNGKGFEGDTEGHGLKNFSARLLKLGGICTVESRVGGGTVVKIHLPLPDSSKTKSHTG